jgi:hypothetical protein
MTVLANSTDHAAQMQARLATQFKDATTWQGLLNAIGAEVQEIEDAFYSILATKVIATATGASLDGIGSILGMPRAEGGVAGALSDADYRTVLTATVLALSGSGEPETALSIVDTIITEWSANTDTVYSDQVAGFRILNLADATTAVKVKRAWKILQIAAGAGIKPGIHYALSARAGLFKFAPSNSFVTSVRGFGQGKFADAQTEVPDDEV